MFRNLFVLRGPVRNLISNYSTTNIASVVNNDVSSVQTSKKTKSILCAAVCVERLPIVSTEMNDIEKKYSDYVNKLNIDKSVYSNHELRHLNDLEKQKKKTANDNDLLIETAIDFEEKCEKELKSFKFGERIVADSEKENYKNINRILDRKVTLLVKNKKIGNWEFPYIEWNDGESLRQTAERSVSDLNSLLKLRFMGNAPVGFYMNPKDTINKNNKIYFFKAQVVRTLNSENFLKQDNYIWVHKNELKNFIKTEDYLNTINKFILDF